MIALWCCSRNSSKKIYELVSFTANELRLHALIWKEPLRLNKRTVESRVKARPVLSHDALHHSDAFKWIGSILEPLFAKKLVLSSIKSIIGSMELKKGTSEVMKWHFHAVNFPTGDVYFASILIFIFSRCSEQKQQ